MGGLIYTYLLIIFSVRRVEELHRFTLEKDLYNRL